MKEKVDSPVTVLEDYFRSSDSESSSSKDPTVDSESQDISKPSSKWHSFLQLLRSRSKKQMTTLHPLSTLKLKRMSNSMRETILPSCLLDVSASPCRSPWKIFTHHEIQVATNCFSQENLIGKGGYAEVYKGCLPNHQLVAIKRLTRGTADEIIGDFLSELGVMAHVNHPNTAKLVGYGVDGGVYLVLELSEKGSLASVLYGSKENRYVVVCRFAGSVAVNLDIFAATSFIVLNALNSVSAANSEAVSFTSQDSSLFSQLFNSCYKNYLEHSRFITTDFLHSRFINIQFLHVF